jgi:fatty acid desaturase
MRRLEQEPRIRFSNVVAFLCWAIIVTAGGFVVIGESFLLPLLAIVAAVVVLGVVRALNHRAGHGRAIRPPD